MKKLMIAVSAVAVLAAGLVLLLWRDGESSGGEGQKLLPKKSAPREAGVKTPSKTPAKIAASNGTANAGKRKLRFARGSAADRTDLSKEDRRLLVAIESAVENDSLEALQRVLSEAGASKNPEIRGDLVDALGWFGDKALLDLMPFMADADADVAQSAIDNWTTALADVEDEKERSRYIVGAMKILTDKDSLDTMIMQLDDCDDLVSLQALVDVIASQNKVAAEVAREHYEFTTGEKYVDLDTANDWISKNYVYDDDGED